MNGNRKSSSEIGLHNIKVTKRFSAKRLTMSVVQDTPILSSFYINCEIREVIILVS